MSRILALIWVVGGVVLIPRLQLSSSQDLLDYGFFETNPYIACNQNNNCDEACSAMAQYSQFQYSCCAKNYPLDKNLPEVEDKEEEREGKAKANVTRTESKYGPGPGDLVCTCCRYDSSCTGYCYPPIALRGGNNMKTDPNSEVECVVVENGQDDDGGRAEDEYMRNYIAGATCDTTQGV